MRFCQNIPTPFSRSFFQNLNFFHFSWHIIWLLCSAVTIYLLTQRSRLSVPFRYIKHVRKVHRKFLDAFKKSFSSKNEVLSEYSNPILSFVSSSFFELKLFSKGLWKIFRGLYEHEAICKVHLTYFFVSVLKK